MNQPSKPRTAQAHGHWWGARAEDWAAVQEATARPAYEAVLAKAGVGAGTRYCDLGCGAGMAASLAAGRGARVSGLDAAAPLLAIARRRTPDGDFHLGEIEQLPFADAAFDVVTGFNAFQFAADPGAALREARRIARPGGSVAIVTWGPSAGMEAAGVIAALAPLLPPAPPGAPWPFALSDEAALRAFAEAGGLRPAEMFDMPSRPRTRAQSRPTAAPTAACACPPGSAACSPGRADAGAARRGASGSTAAFAAGAAGGRSSVRGNHWPPGPVRGPIPGCRAAGAHALRGFQGDGFAKRSATGAGTA